MLRYQFPAFSLQAVDRSKESDTVIRRTAAPVSLEFVRDQPLDAIANAIKVNRRVSVVAAVGAGKSTKLPIQLARTTGMVVIHTIPFELAALHLYEYLKNQYASTDYAFVDSVEQELPQNGVVLMSNTVLMCRYLSGRFDDKTKYLLYMDESHESDACTSVLRYVAHWLTPFASVVTATATLDPGRELKPVLQSSRQIRTFSPQKVSTWRPADLNKPWSVSSMDANTVLVVENAQQRARLKMEYEELGVMAYILDSRVSKEQWFAAKARLADPNEGLIVLLVTYSFRSSFTIENVGVWIESGDVAINTVSNDMPAVMYRDVFDSEFQQFAGRASRLKGAPSIVWRPDKIFEARFTDVEHLEGQAAVLLFRLLGFKPPAEFVMFGQFVGPVPCDIVGALQGDVPLSLIPKTHCEAWIQSEPRLLPSVQSRPQYLPGVGRLPRSVSVSTVPETPRPIRGRTSMSPLMETVERPVSALSFRSVSSLESSPTEYSIPRRADTPPMPSIYVQPKRVARRVQQQREAAAEAEVVRRAVEAEDRHQHELAARLSHVDVAPSSDDMIAAAAAYSRDDTHARRRGLVPQDLTAIHSQLSSITSRGFRLSDDQLGMYYYYSGMNKAISHTAAFLTGYRSVLDFCSRSDAGHLARAMPPEDRLYAVRVLVDRMNECSARCAAITRVFMQMKSRDINDLNFTINKQALMDVIQSTTTNYTAFSNEARMIRDYVYIFQDYALESIPDMSQLEQHYMRLLMNDFEAADQRKSDQSAIDYTMQFMNSVTRRDLPLAREPLGIGGV